LKEVDFSFLAKGRKSSQNHAQEETTPFANFSPFWRYRQIKASRPISNAPKSFNFDID
jgi:hypothetical protein